MKLQTVSGGTVSVKITDASGNTILTIVENVLTLTFIAETEEGTLAVSADQNYYLMEEGIWQHITKTEADKLTEGILASTSGQKIDMKASIFVTLENGTIVDEKEEN